MASRPRLPNHSQVPAAAGLWPAISRSGSQRRMAPVLLYREKYLTKIQFLAILDSMGSVRLIRAPRNEPPALHARAMDNLRYIRETMEGASAFTAVPGWGGGAMGIPAMLTALLAGRQATQDRLLAISIGEALLSFSIAACAVILMSRRPAIPILSKSPPPFPLII